MHLTMGCVDQRNEIHDYEREGSELVLVGSIQDSDYNWDAARTVPLEVDRVARCHKVTRARHSRRDLGKVYPRVDGYMQAEVLGHRVDRADDRVPGFDNRDNRLACSPSALEAGWGAVVHPDAEEAEGTALEGWLGIADQPYLQEHPEVHWVIQKSGALLVVAVELYRQ